MTVENIQKQRSQKVAASIKKVSSRENPKLLKIRVSNRGEQMNIVSIEDVKQYANQRYPRWLDFSQYHCNVAGMPDEANDVLNEVLVSLFSKDFEDLIRLYSAKQGEYTQLDFYILRMLKLNIQSPTSPYKHRRNKYYNRKSEIDVSSIKIIEENDSSVDVAGVSLIQNRLIVFFFNSLDLTEFEKKAFNYHFILDEPISRWPGIESKKNLYDALGLVKTVIHVLLYQQKLTSKEPRPYKHQTKRQKRRINELIQQFYQTHRITIGNKKFNNQAVA